jgi:hypothetical protein
MGKKSRLKPKIYTPEPLVISVVIEAKEVRYATWLQGRERFELVDDFKSTYGPQNVRVLTEKERNSLASNHGGREFR